MRSRSPDGRIMPGTGRRPVRRTSRSSTPRLLRSQFTRLLEPFAERVAVLIFEFGTFAKATFPSVE